MKSFLTKAFAGLFLPVAFAAITKDSGVPNYQPTERIHPYIVEVVKPDGEIENTFSGTSKAQTPFLIAGELGAAPFAEDKFKVLPDISIGIGGKITLLRAPDFTIRDGKKIKTVRSWQKTVGEVLAEAKVPEMGQDDKINFPLDTEAISKMEIKITRVSVTTIVQPEKIDFKTTKKPNANLEKGIKNVLQSGKAGKKNKFYEVRREDGEEVSRKLLKTEVVEEPTEEILEVGTKIIVLDSGKATWYVRTSEMLAASNTIPKGTKVKIVNLNNGKSVICTTSGGGIYHDDNVVVDLSTAAFQALGASLGTGKLSSVRVEKYYPEE